MHIKIVQFINKAFCGSHNDHTTNVISLDFGICDQILETYHLAMHK